MRPTIAIVSLLFSTLSAVPAEQAVTPDALLQRGIAGYRAARYAEAATDLNAAAQALLAPEQLQNYVNSGKFPNLDKFETALVYLTLAESKLGRDDRAREAVLRLTTAERIESVYPQLPLEADAAPFETIAHRLVPDLTLPANAQLARGGAPAPAPAPAATTTTATSVAEATPPPAPAPAPPPAPAAVPAAQTSTTVTAEERAKIEKEADERIAAERAAIQKAADERIAQVQRAADQRIASLQHSFAEQMTAIQNQNREAYLVSLRRADAMAENGQLARANDIYQTIVNSPGVAREIVAEAATGLYRTGAYANAVSAFQKLMPFARGEEDLRYYDAVALYETGAFGDAKKQLACALPFIEVTDDVTRARAKIEPVVSSQR